MLPAARRGARRAGVASSRSRSATRGVTETQHRGLPHGQRHRASPVGRKSRVPLKRRVEPVQTTPPRRPAQAEPPARAHSNPSERAEVTATSRKWWPAIGPDGADHAYRNQLPRESPVGTSVKRYATADALGCVPAKPYCHTNGPHQLWLCKGDTHRTATGEQRYSWPIVSRRERLLPRQQPPQHQGRVSVCR